MRQEVLEELGLSKNEAKVYLALLGIGSASVGKITKESGVHRRNVYDALERLMKRGLVGDVTKSKVKYFEVANPNRLLDILNKEKESMKKKENGIKSILPELLMLCDTKKQDEYVNVYKGREGIVTILEDVLKTGRENLVLGARVPKELLPVIERYHKQRLKLKVPLKMLFNKADRKRGMRLSKEPNTEVRFLPNAYDSPITANIYGSKVGLLIWSEKNPMGILIQNHNVYVGFKEFFKLIWNVAED
jgi:sugar-specific transcriptional regulator TrmB